MKQVILIVLLSIICCRGGGLSELYNLAVKLLLILSFYVNVSSPKLIVRNIISMFLFALSIIQPSFFLLWGGVALCVALVDWRYCFIPLSFWLLELLGVYPQSYFWILTLLFGLLLCIRGLKFYAKKTHILLFVSFLIVVLQLISLPVFHEGLFIKQENYNIYGQSKTFSRISNCTYLHVDTVSAVPIIRNNSYSPEYDRYSPGIVIYDIDLNKEDAIALNTRLQQKTPWGSQMYLGDQYYLESICSDGALYSNIGVILKQQSHGVQMLSRPLGIWDSYPLILKNSKTLYINDSDYMSSYLANYQRNFIRELSAPKNFRPNLVRIWNVACLCFLMCYLLSYDRKVLLGALGVIIIPFLLLKVYSFYEPGEIRMVGRIKNSHENSGFDGVPKMINSNGFEYCVGNIDAKVLVVKHGRFAVWKGESLIVAESDARIKIGDSLIEIGSVPCGVVDGIIDSRNVMFNGINKGAILKYNDITIIGTDAPSKIEWKRFLIY